MILGLGNDKHCLNRLAYKGPHITTPLIIEVLTALIEHHLDCCRSLSIFSRRDNSSMHGFVCRILPL